MAGKIYDDSLAGQGGKERGIVSTDTTTVDSGGEKTVMHQQDTAGHLEKKESLS